MKCLIISLFGVQLIIVINTLIVATAMALPAFNSQDIWKVFAHALPLAQLIAFLPSTAIIVCLSMFQITNWRKHAPVMGSAFGAVLYVIIGLLPLVPKLTEGLPINLLPAIIFNAIVGGGYGMTIGVFLKWVGTIDFCKPN